MGELGEGPEAVCRGGGGGIQAIVAGSPLLGTQI